MNSSVLMILLPSIPLLCLRNGIRTEYTYIQTDRQRRHCVNEGLADVHPNNDLYWPSHHGAHACIWYHNNYHTKLFTFERTSWMCTCWTCTVRAVYPGLHSTRCISRHAQCMLLPTQQHMYTCVCTHAWSNLYSLMGIHLKPPACSTPWWFTFTDMLAMYTPWFIWCIFNGQAGTYEVGRQVQLYAKAMQH